MAINHQKVLLTGMVIAPPSDPTATVVKNPLVEICQSYVKDNQQIIQFCYVRLLDIGYNGNPQMTFKVNELILAEGEFRTNEKGGVPQTKSGDFVFIVEAYQSRIHRLGMSDGSERNDVFSIVLTGWLGQEPKTPDGQKFSKSSIAYNQEVKLPDDTKVKKVTWFSLTAWRKQKEMLDALHKGEYVYIEGNVSYDPQLAGPRSWESKTEKDADGNPLKNSGFEINVGYIGTLVKHGESQAEPFVAPGVISDIPF